MKQLITNKLRHMLNIRQITVLGSVQPNQLIQKAAQSALLMICLGLFLSACSSDDTPSVTINAGQQTFTFNGINNCSTSEGDGTIFSLDIPYTTSANLTISQLLITSTVTDGSSNDAINTQFTDSNGVISWATCFTFGSQDWVDYQVQLESTDGILSNPTTVRVDKPAGAN